MSFFHPSPDDRRVIEALRKSGDARMRPDAQQRISQALLREVERMQREPLVQHSPAPARGPLNIRVALALLAVIAMLVIGVGGAIAADRSVPGDPLFGLDRALERLQMKMAVREEARAHLATLIATERERECGVLLQEKRLEVMEAATPVVDQALADAQTLVRRAQEQAVSDGGDRARLERLQQDLKLLEASLETHEQHGVDYNSLKGVAEVRHEQPSDPASRSAVQVSVMVDLHQAKTDIETIIDGTVDTWSMETTNRTALIQGIVHRTGLTTADVEARWSLGVR